MGNISSALNRMIKAPTTPLKQNLPLNLTSFEQRFADKYRECALNCSKIFSDPSFDLPMLPATGIRMMKLLQDPDASPRKIATALQTDAVVTAKFLRLANSPFYAGTRKVESVQFAIDRLGMSTTRNVIMSISVNSTIVRERRLGERAMGIWEHAKNAALAAQLLASRLELMPQRAYMMGLMHDIGYLPAWIMIHDLAKQLPGVRPEIYKSLVEEVHVDVGNWLMTVWAMPADVCVAVGAHHLVTSVRDAMEFIIKSRTDVSVTDCSSMSAHLGCMVIADKALAVLKSSDESCDQDLGKLELAGDIGLSEELLNNYLAQLPKFLSDNHFKEM